MLRYDEEGAPLQEVFYFPLLPRLSRMYKQDEWRRAIRYPQERPRRLDSRSDVFDGTVYKEIRRGAGACEDFVTFDYCVDGVGVDSTLSCTVLSAIVRYVRVRSNFLLSIF